MVVIRLERAWHINSGVMHLVTHGSYRIGKGVTYQQWSHAFGYAWQLSDWKGRGISTVESFIWLRMVVIRLERAWHINSGVIHLITHGS